MFVESVDLVIVGAGQSGLASAFAARAAGVSAVVLEASATPAGSWPRYYDSLRLFSPARYSSLPGRPLPGDPDRYPTRDEIAGYLQDYASQFGDTICLGERVESVVRASDGCLDVATTSGSELHARTVIAASGSFGSPHRPPLTGLDRFPGSVLHAADYDAPERFAGKRVVVVGAGNSAVQIAVELAEVAKTTLATRAQVKWVEQRPFGRDIHWWLKTTRLDTAPLSRLLFELPVAVLDAGSYRAALAAGRFDRQPMFDRLDGGELVWSGGGREPLDVLILATGYRPHLPYLADTTALGPDGRPLHRGGVSTTVPGLGYVGLEFQRSFSSNTLRGCARDARHVVGALQAQVSPDRVAVPLRSSPTAGSRRRLSRRRRAC